MTPPTVEWGQSTTKPSAAPRGQRARAGRHLPSLTRQADRHARPPAGPRLPANEPEQRETLVPAGTVRSVTAPFVRPGQTTCQSGGVATSRLYHSARGKNEERNRT